MQIRDILLSAGSTALNVFAPGAGTLVHGLLNKYLFDGDLPDANQLTGDDAAQLISTKLTPQQQAMILDRTVDLEIQLSIERAQKDDNTVRIRELEHKEILDGKSPRPEAVRAMVKTLVGQIVMLMIIVFVITGVNIYLVINERDVIKLTDVLPDLTLMGTLIFTPAYVIIHYFNNRSKDNKVNAIRELGGDPAQLMGLGGALASRILKR